jgi:coenzyme F420-reducing hydrogenase gamma subunit
MTKPKIAFFDFTSCEGCQLTVVDALQTHPELLNVVDIVQFREAMTEKGEDYQIAFIEGSCSRASDEARLRRVRERAQIVVALGACAHLGGVNAMRNRQPLDDVREYVYGEYADWYDTYPARPISAVIAVDAFLPGCPIDREEFVRVTKQLLQGRHPQIPDYPLCVECKLRETVCLYQRPGAKAVCLGPVVRAGCNAICPAYGDACEGCRGLVSNPNLAAMESVLAEAGLPVEQLMARYTLFGTYQLDGGPGTQDRGILSSKDTGNGRSPR